MPAETGILGFANRWYPLAVDTAQSFILPGGREIRLITAPAFIATKFEAFTDRGKGDLLASHDLEDIINVFGGRAEIVNEIEQASPELRAYLGARCRGLLETPDFMDFLPGMIFPDELLAERVSILAHKIRQIAAWNSA